MKKIIEYVSDHAQNAKVDAILCVKFTAIMATVLTILAIVTGKVIL